MNCGVRLMSLMIWMDFDLRGFIGQRTNTTWLRFLAVSLLEAEVFWKEKFSCLRCSV